MAETYSQKLPSLRYGAGKKRFVIIWVLSLFCKIKDFLRWKYLGPFSSRDKWYFQRHCLPYPKTNFKQKENIIPTDRKSLQQLPCPQRKLNWHNFFPPPSPSFYFSCRVWPPSSRAKDVCNYKPYFLSSDYNYEVQDSSDSYSKKWPFIKHFSPLYDNSQKLFTRRVETSLSSYGIVVVVTFWGTFSGWENIWLMWALS